MNIPELGRAYVRQAVSSDAILHYWTWIR